MRVDVVRRFAVLAQVSGIALDRLAFIVADALGVGLYKASIKDAAGQAFVIVRLDCFEIMDGDSGLVADLTQADAALLAGESQSFAYTCCHLQSLVPGAGWVGPPLV